MFLQLEKKFEKCLQMFILWFQNLDDHLEEASDKLFFEHFVDCYAAFHHGRDDYSEEIGCLEEKFMEVYEINENIAEDLV